MLISVHLPKTAGSSFAKALEEQFGDSLLKDYSDLPLHHTTFSRNKYAITQSVHHYFKEFGDVKCIHGHFLPLKYRFRKVSDQFKYVTWMREPAERLASQYYYMTRHYTQEKAQNQPLLKKMIDEDWSLERFCLGPELRNTYSKFLWGFPIKRFDFIGIVEHFDSDLLYFSNNIINLELINYAININTKRPQEQSYYKDKDLKIEIMKHHRKDYDLYNYALNQRLLRSN